MGIRTGIRNAAPEVYRKVSHGYHVTRMLGHLLGRNDDLCRLASRAGRVQSVLPVARPVDDKKGREEARAAAAATGILPLEYMLSVMRDPAADHDAMAMPAAPYLHPKLGAVELSPMATSETAPHKMVVEFVMPSRDHTQEELIISDNGSTDRTAQICRNYQL